MEHPAMKTRHVQFTVLAAMAMAALINGCASSGYEKGNETAANIQAAGNLIGALPGQIDATLESLNNLIQKPQTDLRPQHELFAANVAKLESSAKEVADARKSMAERQKEFFARWDEQLAQLQNEDIKARSQSRKDEVMRKMTAIKLNYTEAETAFKPFMSSLKDMEKYLSVDLTPGGIAAMKDSAAKATQEAAPLKESIAKVAEAFKELGVSMSSVAPQQQPQQPK